jgi:hypothetical protein
MLVRKIHFRIHIVLFRAERRLAEGAASSRLSPYLSAIAVAAAFTFWL